MKNRVISRKSVPTGLLLISGAASIFSLTPWDAPPAAAAQSAPPSAASPATDDPAATYAKAVIYLYGNGVPQDEKKALQLFQDAADRGHGDALAAVGLLYAEGKIVERDDVKARDFYERAVARESGYGKVRLARFLVEGRGGPKDPQRALQILQPLVDQGSKTAATMLGEIYFWGDHADGRPDYPRSFATIKGLAEGGDAHTQNMVGVMIRDRRIEGYDPKTARDWFLKAAQQGDGKACLNLGQLDFESPDRATRVEALKWLTVGKLRKDVAAEYFLADIKTRVREDEMKEAQALAEAVAEKLPKK